MPRLIFEDPQSGQEVSVDIGPELSDVTIGRSPGNVVRINQPSVSREHAEIIYENGQCTIRDLDSSNGTYINGTPVQNQVLRDGDRIQVGDFPLDYVEPWDEAQQQAEASAPGQPMNQDGGPPESLPGEAIEEAGGESGGPQSGDESGFVQSQPSSPGPEFGGDQGDGQAQVPAGPETGEQRPKGQSQPSEVEGASGAGDQQGRAQSGPPALGDAQSEPPALGDAQSEAQGGQQPPELGGAASNAGGEVSEVQ
ncbi:MAG: FHA domain-containing protein, partial [Bradymonadaceae bacterium]